MRHVVSVIVLLALGPGVAEAQSRVVSVQAASGTLAQLGNGGLVVSVTGVGTAVGRSDDAVTGWAHIGGWASIGGLLPRGDDTPLRLTNVRVDGVTPDSAVVTFSSSLPVRSIMNFGPTDDYGQRVEVASGQAVRVSGLAPGELYHYQLTVIDRFGRRRRTRDAQLCTPAEEEITKGLIQADYYSGRDFGNLVVSRPEATIDQPDRADGDREGDFGSGAGPDNFSVRWQGFVKIDQPGDHSWRSRYDDGMRLFVDGQPAIDAWREANSTRQSAARTNLDASWHALKLEYFNGEGPAIMELDLGGPGIPLQPLPTDRIAHVNEAFYAPAFEPRDAPVLECNSPAGARTRLDPPDVFDCHDSSPLVINDAPRTLPLGTTRVVWTARNKLGSRSLLAETVEVIDTVPPVVDAPAAMVVEAASPQGTVVAMPEPDAVDTCDDALSFSYHLCNAGGDQCQACWTEEDEADDPRWTAGGRNPDCECEAMPGRLPLGTVHATVIATDDFGNCGSARFDVTVQDTTPPTIGLGDIEFVCQEAPIPQAVLRDNSTPADDIDVTCSIDGGAPRSCDGTMNLPNGDHTVRYDATDAQGLSSNATLEFNVGEGDGQPPTALLQSATSGFTNGEASVTIRVRDNCDVAPGAEFDPDGDTSQDGGDHTVTYAADGIYSVQVTATDDVGNSAVFTVPDFGIDTTAPTATFTGLDEVDDPEDSLTWEAFFPEDSFGFSVGASDREGDALSGISRVVAVLTHLESGEERVMLDVAHGAEGVPAAGPTRLKNIACDEVLGQGDVAYCDDDGDLAMADLQEGDYELVVTAHDHAGNTGSTARHFIVMSWRIAIERAVELTQGLLDDGQDGLVELFLDLVIDVEADALTAVGEPLTRGNALLYTYTMINSLQFAEGQGVDTGDSRLWLNQGAVDGIRKRQGEAEAQGPVDAGDFDHASGELDEAESELASANYTASILTLMNALFRLEHSLAPYAIERWEDASAATFRLRNEMLAYGRIEGAGGQESVAQMHDVLEGIILDGLFGRATGGGDQAAANTAFLDLLVRLATLSDMLGDAQDDEWVWTRNWQWPVSLQVRTMSGLALDSAMVAMGEDPDDPQDDLLAEVADLHDEGVGFIEDRLVDDALQVYVNNRCAIFELYNHANFDPQGVPPDDWGCEDCVLTGDCDRD